jgi:L-histidine N-alpha-methyltransferase
MHENNITVHDHLPADFTSYVKETIATSLYSPIPHIPTRLLYTEEGSALFKQFTESNKQHSSQLEKTVMESFPAFDRVLQASDVLVELGAGSFERTLRVITKIKPNAAYAFWAVDCALEPAFTALKKLHRLNNNCSCRLLLADYELPVLKTLIGPAIGNMTILWLGNSCVNVFPAQLESILENVQPQKNVDRTLAIGINLAAPSNERCEQLLYHDKQGLFAAFRMSSLKLLEKELNVTIPWQQLRWKTYYRESIHAYVSAFASNAEWEMPIDANNRFVFKKDAEIIVGYSHAYTFEELNAVIKRSGWYIQAQQKDEQSGYAILLLKPIHI